jgi:hypothetical protein
MFDFHAKNATNEIYISGGNDPGAHAPLFQKCGGRQSYDFVPPTFLCNNLEKVAFLAWKSNISINKETKRCV